MDTMLGRNQLLCAPVTLLIATVSILAWASGSLTAALEINFQQPLAASLLQSFGCHVLHWSGEHIFWDLAMFALLGFMCERSMPRAFYATLLVSALAIPSLVPWWNPGISTYRGLSGLDTACFSLLVTSGWLRSINHKDPFQAVLLGLLLIGLGGKIAFEFYTGQVMFVHRVDFVPLPIAHAVGALVGSFFACSCEMGKWTFTGSAGVDSLKGAVQSQG